MMDDWSRFDRCIKNIEKEKMREIYASKHLYSIDEMESCINDIVDKVEGKIVDVGAILEYGNNFFYILSGENKRRLMRIDNNHRLKAMIRVLGRRDSSPVVSYDLKWIKPLLPKRPAKYIFAFLWFGFWRIRGAICINQELKKKGLCIERNWWEHCSVTYSDIYEDTTRYREALNNGDKTLASFWSKNVFGDYLFIRDFNNAQRWMNIAKREAFDKEDREALDEIWVEIEKAMKETEQVISGSEHVVIHWIDGLRYDELPNMRFVEETAKSGIFFEKMYTPTDYTHATEKAMFCDKLQIDDRSWEIEERDICKYSFPMELKREGYEMVVASCFLFPEDNECYNIGLYRSIFSSRAKATTIPASLMMYYGLCRIENNIKSFCLLHYVSEIHPPRVSPDYPKELTKKYIPENEYTQYMNQVIAGEKYLDSTIEYYHRFFRHANYNIYMSDHGQVRTENTFSPQAKHHVIFSITGKNIEEGIISRTASLLDFSYIIKDVIHGECNLISNDNMKGYALIQRDDSYGCDFNFALQGSAAERKLFTFIQYRGIITDRDSYTRFVTGEEYYYLDGDDTKNLINDTRYKERIRSLRELTGKTYIDIYKEKRYVSTREFYKKHRILRDNSNKYC